MEKRRSVIAAIRRAEDTLIVRTIRGGLVSMIPVLLIGAFALILKTFPVEFYQKAVTNFAGGFLMDLFNLVYSATFGMLSVYMTYFISRSYMKFKADADSVHGGAAAAAWLAASPGAK